MTLAPGTRLGPYEIVAPLGAGGMGEVWRAKDTRLGREVAIKVLPESLAASADRLARLEREARAAAAISHPNVVVLHSVEEAGGTRFLTMELVEGRPLDQLVAAGGLPLPRVLELAIPLADALASAHARGVVHRDLKPANVMVTREGRLKVLDFGLARFADEVAAIDATQAATVAAPLSSAGQVVGTVPYMSPEQLRGDVVDARSDLFSFGILVYELATGRRPFGGSSSAEISSAILRDPAPLARAVRGDLPADLERVLARCLEKDPERRIQTAKDVRNELELLRRAGESGSVPAAPPSGTVTAVREQPSIAVLPFENRSRDEEDEYFAEGLADELLTVLGRIRGLRVAARTSSRQFKGHAEDPATIGRRLNVATLLEGSVRKSGSRVRIAVQLVNAGDGVNLWSETYDRTLDDIFAVQDDIAQAVVKEPRAHLLGPEPDSKASGEVKAEIAAAAAGRGANAEAHRFYLQGRFLLDRLGEADMSTAIAALERAVALEPGHALAWAMLSIAHTLTTGLGATEVETGMALARAAAERALALEPDLPEALVALARVHIWYDFDWGAARTCCERALATAPDNADVLRAASNLEYTAGNFERAAAHARRAAELDPLSVTAYQYLGRVQYVAGVYDEAESAFRRAIDMAPASASTHGLLALMLSDQGRAEEALATALVEPAEWARLWALAIVHHRAGRAAESDAALAGLVERWGSKAQFQIASVYAVRGEHDEAFAWLARARDEHDSGISVAKSVVHLRGLQGDPRWKPFLRTIGMED